MVFMAEYVMSACSKHKAAVSSVSKAITMLVEVRSLCTHSHILGWMDNPSHDDLWPKHTVYKPTTFHWHYYNTIMKPQICMLPTCLLSSILGWKTRRSLEAMLHKVATWTTESYRLPFRFVEINLQIQIPKEHSVNTSQRQTTIAIRQCFPGHSYRIFQTLQKQGRTLAAHLKLSW